MSRWREIEPQVEILWDSFIPSLFFPTLSRCRKCASKVFSSTKSQNLSKDLAFYLFFLLF